MTSWDTQGTIFNINLNLNLNLNLNNKDLILDHLSNTSSLHNKQFTLNKGLEWISRWTTWVWMMILAIIMPKSKD